MKFTFSKVLIFSATDVIKLLSDEIIYTCSETKQAPEMPSQEEIIDEIVEAYTGYKNVRATIVGDEVIIEIDDTVIEAYLAIYRKIASFIDPVWKLWKAITTTVSDDIEKITRLLNERS